MNFAPLLTSSFLAVLLLQPVTLADRPVERSGVESGKKKPVKVFILAGQSNMEGVGRVSANYDRNEGKGTLEYLVKKSKEGGRYRHLVGDTGDWLVREDVWIWYLGRKGGLSVGYGARKDTIGPELQFGHVMGDLLDAQVLLIKIAWGGKSLARDFRPPSSGGETGAFYSALVEHTWEVLASLSTHFPGYEGQGYELAGLAWHQGWNDGLKRPWVAEYEENLANLIKDLRSDLKTRDLPVVIATSGFGGRKQKIDRRLGIIAAQHAVARRKELEGTVATVETRDFFRPPEESPSRQGYHWNGNAETYFLIGDAMGKAMGGLIRASKAE